MKKDLRVQYPLWQMAFIVLFGFIAFSLTGASTELYKTSEEFSFSVELDALESFLLLGALFITVLMITIFSMKISKHNKQNPSQKLSLWQIRPLEYLEQDEGMMYITRRAAQKVYTFFVWALPLMATIFLVFELSRFWMIFGILILAWMQYLIYYIEVRKHFSDGEE
ncbi:hypothetical protein HMPREF1210_00205 [Paenisporosarcina sp. HGH0030]|uniref:hypothetical protein n=1 Tax=Paenisporosarcina sp. HGH0030 TaxID=1078085 RepID=UPI00034E0C75|nr:hypothetical protein [Paenisporosarcina sp. HGH0030]EPD54220.1 hypothetical protein HMPREF1210_00205 [Paenisporosarcina sp. HGH0030]